MITPPPTAPSTLSPTTFATDMDNYLAWIALNATELNTVATAFGLSLGATSVTSLTVGTGSKSLTVDTGKGYLPGIEVVIAYTTTATTRMIGTVTSYNSGTGALVVSVSEAAGSGTYTAWTVTATLAAGYANRTFTNSTFTNYTETAYVPAANSAFTVDLANGTLQKLTTNANCTVTLPTPAAGKSFTIQIAYGGTHTLSWAGGGTIKWSGGSAPTATSVNGKADTFNFYSVDGSNTFGASGGSNA